MKRFPRIMTHTDSYVTHYPQFIEFADTQLEKCFWTSNEIAIEKDKQDMLVNMTEAEHHAVITALKLFLKYELFVGNEYWGSRVAKMFPRPEIQRMASVFAMTELAVHAPFYNKLNEVLGLNTDEFYTSYVEDETLRSRVGFLVRVVNSKNDLLSLAVFSIIEGAILFSSFAMFKNFQSNGNNLISNTVRGINQSVIDEGLHQTAGAALFRVALKESKLTVEEHSELFIKIYEAANILNSHEERIVDMLFEKGNPRGINALQLKTFVKSRINICLNDLGATSVFTIEDNPVAEWFYTAMNGYQSNDFFSGIGREYQKSWDEKKFTWKGNNV
jgi:ribonucleoside-diphosphate reductase beta chain